jgi:hypothetical protein
MKALRLLFLVAGISVPALFVSCAGPGLSFPTEGERRFDMLQSQIKDEGYHYSAEELPGHPEGVPMPLINAEHPEKNATVVFRHYRLPRGVYRVFSDNGHVGGYVWPREPVATFTESPAEMEVCTAVIEQPVTDDSREARPKRLISCALAVHALRKRGVAGVLYSDDMSGSVFVADSVAPASARLQEVKFDPAVFPVLNLQYYDNGNLISWVRYWLEPAGREDRGPAMPKFMPPLPARR